MYIDQEGLIKEIQIWLYTMKPAHNSLYQHIRGKVLFMPIDDFKKREKSFGKNPTASFREKCKVKTLSYITCNTGRILAVGKWTLLLWW